MLFIQWYSLVKQATISVLVAGQFVYNLYQIIVTSPSVYIFSLMRPLNTLVYKFQALFSYIIFHDP